jgi:alpha-ketoglutarate-dependent taurine dioxygenase
MAVKTLEVRPLKAPVGAEIYHLDLPNLTEADFEIIRNALYNYHVVVLKNQSAVSPKDQ